MRLRLRSSALFVAILACQYPLLAQSTAPSPRSEVRPTPVVDAGTIAIPGPLRSFMRMAGISQKAAPEDVLPLLAHNVFQQGYVSGVPTEWLKLLDGYVAQARALQTLAGPANTITVANCESVGPLLQILGYRQTQPCGQKNITLVTQNADLAFLTSDSGFPLTDLEESLQKGVPFSYPYAASRVPILLWESEWVALDSAQKMHFSNLLEVLINTPSIARLYWALDRSDSETRTSLQKSPGLAKLLPVAPLLDFYGGEISVHSGRVMVPGGSAAEPAWKELVGANPASPGEFVSKLLSKDEGWMAAYFDVLARLNSTQQQHFTQSPRLAHLYQDFRLSNPKPGAARSVFRQAPDLLSLDTLIMWEPNGSPHVPGDLGAWKDILLEKTKARSVHDWNKRFQSWDQPEQLLEAITAFCRTTTDSGPIQMYLLMSQIDLRRGPGRGVSPTTVTLLAKRFSQYKDWYLLFSEFPELTDDSIALFIRQADAIDKIQNQTLRANGLGILQANVGLWQILARQHQIADADLNQSWEKLLQPFGNITGPIRLFDAGRESFQSLVASAGGPAGSASQIVDLLAGPTQASPEGQQVRRYLSTRIRAVLEDQKLVSLDTLFALSDGLDSMARGGPKDTNLVSLAGELQDFELPKPIFTNYEKLTWAPMNYVTHHQELQLKTDLAKLINAPSGKAQLAEARGRLAPFLRDTLVGLNYAYYEPPNSHILHNNPLFVRAHDFTGLSIMGFGSVWGQPQLVGAGFSAGGGAYLMGSLAELPFALAQAEQDFIAPENIQALVWKELIPNLMEDAITMRWWAVSPKEIHAAALYQRSGEEILARAATDESLRGQVLTLLSERISPERIERVDAALTSKDESSVLRYVLPADTFFLAAEFRQRFPDRVAAAGPASKQLDEMVRSSPEEISFDRLSRDFGSPHPSLAYTYSRELLNVKPFPFAGGYAVRYFGESWQSSDLYWARLADEMGYTPAALNRLVPDLTRRMAGKIFATELEDWPAILRAMVETGDEARRRKPATEPVVSANRVLDETNQLGKEQ